MFVFKAAVVGAGTMGGQIAQTIAVAGIPVVLKDVRDELVDRGLQEVRDVTARQLAKLVEKGRLAPEAADAQVEAVVGRVTGTTEYDGFGDVDFVIEAVPERLDFKQTVFEELDEVTPGHAVLGSNTSSLSITSIAEATSRPDKVVGFHYFYPASVMRLIEVVEAEETGAATLQAAINFAQAIRKTPIACAEVPGFIVNRVLTSAASEVWRMQAEQGLSIARIDEAITASKLVPMGPFMLADALGLDTVERVTEHLNRAYPGGRFYLHRGMTTLVAEGKFGAKSGGNGFYRDGQPQIAGDAEPDIEELTDRFTLKAFVESCMLVEEGVATTRDVDLGLMAGAGLIPAPFARADATGLDAVLERLEEAADEWGESFEPPMLLRRLINQRRTGPRAGQGFFPYKRADEGFEQGAALSLETRGDVALLWLDNPPANSVSPAMFDDLERIWAHLESSGTVRAVVFASANPLIFSAGADIKSFPKMDETSGRAYIARGHGLLRAMERSSIATIAAVNALAYGGGCELAMACDVRIAAESAVFGQPEIELGIIPGLGGTQRLPRLVGVNKALEMNLTGQAISAEEAYEFGLVNRIVPDHELLDTALAWARKLAAQAPLAVAGVKRASAKGDLDAGIEAEQEAFAEVFFTEDAREGISAFMAKREPRWRGR